MPEEVAAADRRVERPGRVQDDGRPSRNVTGHSAGMPVVAAFR
jgi:hypothetical protein